jgi:beta-mannosidase
LRLSPVSANIDLVFDGLDAASTVNLNGVQVLAADNMFRIWRAPDRDCYETL